MINVHPSTGIHYGVISSNSLRHEVTDELLYGSQATDHSYETALQAWRDDGHHPDDFEYEPHITGTLDGVKYASCWLGGALLFFILESPHTGEFALCSPCIPNTADCDTPGAFTGYTVPADWLNED